MKFSLKNNIMNVNIEVPCIDFANCLEIYVILYYLKIDIEGMVFFRGISGLRNYATLCFY